MDEVIAARIAERHKEGQPGIAAQVILVGGMQLAGALRKHPTIQGSYQLTVGVQQHGEVSLVTAEFPGTSVVAIMTDPAFDKTAEKSPLVSLP